MILDSVLVLIRGYRCKHISRPKADPVVSRSSYNLPQTPMSPKLSSGALLEKYGAGVGSGIPTHSTPSSLLGTKMHS